MIIPARRQSIAFENYAVIRDVFGSFKSNREVMDIAVQLRGTTEKKIVKMMENVTQMSGYKLSF